MIKMTNPGQETPSSNKAPNQDLKDKDDLCTFKIKIESQKLVQKSIKVQELYPIYDQDAKLNQEPPASLLAQDQDLKDIEVLRTFKINLESQNLDQGFIKVQQEP